MIACLQIDNLPVIDFAPEPIESVPGLTLTEVACAAIYGSPLTPERLRSAWNTHLLENLALWWDEKGPGWLCPHLELIARRETWPIASDTKDNDERKILEDFARAESWLYGRRRSEHAGDLPATATERVETLSAMTSEQAIAFATSEAHRIERTRGDLKSKATRFYRLLNEAIATRSITLKAISTNPRTRDWLPKVPGEPPHQPIDFDHFELVLVHDLTGNDLDVDRYSAEARSLDAIYVRSEREEQGLLTLWSNVTVPAADARRLLSLFDDGDYTDGGRLRSATSALRETTTWNPSWLSLAGAITWVVTRDKVLTGSVDKFTDNDRGVEGLVAVHLAYEELQTGRSHSKFVEIGDAWPAIRRSIGDEKIVAEGHSKSRHGDHVRCYPNERIPSGDATNLIILDRVPGIEPSDALGPDELYRFNNWQGRYWYRVRLCAADVFREFPKAEFSASASVRITSAAVVACRTWLAEQMRASPGGRPKSKRELYLDACACIPNIGSPKNAKPSRGFERAWSLAMSDTGCEDAWTRAGAPRKSPR